MTAAQVRAQDDPQLARALELVAAEAVAGTDAPTVTP